ELSYTFTGPLVYDCMDDLAAFDFAPVGMRDRERSLMERANVIFAGGRSLYASRLEFQQKMQLHPSGVEFERFSAAPQIAPHPLVAELSHPVYGYAGVVDEGLDYDIF